jgi:hypothetical protein
MMTGKGIQRRIKTLSQLDARHRSKTRSRGGGQNAIFLSFGFQEVQIVPDLAQQRFRLLGDFRNEELRIDMKHL